jgi:hypothetical protein
MVSKKVNKKDILITQLWMEDPYASFYCDGKWTYVCPYCNVKVDEPADDKHSSDCKWLVAKQLIKEI